MWQHGGQGRLCHSVFAVSGLRRDTEVRTQTQASVSLPQCFVAQRTRIMECRLSQKTQGFEQTAVVRKPQQSLMVTGLDYISALWKAQCIEQEG